MRLIKSSSRGITSIDWLLSFHSFSFGNYYDPEKTGFGPLRVLNDDTVQPGAGFSLHPHKDMEIITIVLDGAIEHADSTGTKEVIDKREIQKMTAGKGIYHSEFNHSDTEILKFIQIWITPNKPGLNPSYQKIDYPSGKNKNVLYKIGSWQEGRDLLHINQDAELYLSEYDEGNSLIFPCTNGRGIYFFLIEGEAKINDNILNPRDAFSVTEKSLLNIEFTKKSSFLLFDLKM